MALSDRLRALAARPVGLACALALVLSLGSLGGGFFADDQVHLAAIERTFPSMSIAPFSLYTFSSGVRREVSLVVDRGPFPWWTLRTLRFAFCRPLSSALRTLDHHAFGHAPLGYHVHSALWYVALVAAVALVFRRALPVGPAALAAAIYALDGTHGSALAWISARHVSVGAAPALLGLWAHLRWREERWWPGLPLSLLGLVVGLLGSELALGMCGFVVAYELAHAPSRKELPWRGILPVTLVALGYLVLYRHLDFGTRGSGAYLDPLQDPRAFSETVLSRFGTLLLALDLRVPAELWVKAGPLRPLLAVVGFASALFAGLVVRAVWSELPEASRRALGWLCPGALLALLPGLAVAPGDRLLVFPGVGAAAGVGVLLHHALTRGPLLARWLKLALRAAAVIFLGLSPLVMLFQCAVYRHWAHEGQRLFAESDLPREPGRDVVVVNPSDPLEGLYLSALASLDPRTRYRSFWMLSMAPGEHVVRRVGPRTLELQVEGGMFVELFETLFRAGRFPIREGDRFPLDGASVTVLTAREGRPYAISMEFERPLEDPRYAFLAWDGRRVARVALPPVGGPPLLLPHRPGPMGL